MIQPHRVLLFVGLAMASAGLPGAESPRFPKPDPAAAFRELKIFSGDGQQPFRIPIEDWDGARQRVATDPPWQRWLRDLRAEMDDWMARCRDRVEWVAGWWHDFVSPKDGSFLKWTPDEPGEETLHSDSDPRVALTPKLHAAWVYGFRSRHAAKIAEAARLYRLTDERRYADWVVSQLDFYATNFHRWNGRTDWGKERSRLTWQSLDEAVNLIRYVTAVRLLGNRVPTEVRQRWYRKFFRPEADLLERSFQRIHNIACWHRAAQAQVALCFDDKTLWHQAVYGPFGLQRQLAEGVTGDYLWFEQSLGYNSYVVGALQGFFEVALQAGRGRELEIELCTVQNLMLAPILMRFPTGQLPNPADSTGGPSRAPNRALLASTYRIFPTPIGLAQASGQRDWNTLLDPPGPAPDQTLPAVTSRHLESSRMAILKRGPWQVYFHYGQLDASHAQAEALNFEAFLDDIDVSHDPGTVGYGSPLHRGFYTKGPAHNVPLVNGQGQAGWNPGEVLQFDADQGVVFAAQPRYRPDASAQRELRIVENSLVDRTTLTFTGGGSPRLGLALHVQGAVELPADFAAADGFASAGPGFEFWEKPRTARATNELSLTVQLGERVLDLTLAAPGPFQVTHGVTPDVPPRHRESLYVETNGRETTFTTTWVPRR